VTHVMQHTNSKIQYWEVWNEPESFAADGTPAQYAKLVVNAYNAAKAVNPAIQIGLSVTSVDINYLKQAILAGAAGHYDYIAVHPYEIVLHLDQGWEPVFMNIERSVHIMLATVDPSRANVPVWFTELGFYSSGTPLDQQQARTLVKSYTMGIAQGIQVVDWYEGKDGQGGFGLLRGDLSPRPAYTALQNLILYLGQTPNYIGWVQFNTSNYGFVFKGINNTNLMVLWSLGGLSYSIELPFNVRVVSPFTGKLTPISARNPIALSNDPVIVLDISAQVVTQAQNDKNLPFSWGGDYSKAKSVSLSLGNNIVMENGLHHLSGDQSSRIVVAYGILALDCNLSPGQSFTVDPNFLCYSPEPITISISLRRKEDNSNAGFNLDYEGPNGWKTTGSWYTVPGNDQWYTYSVTLNDPQFVNMWGYNFNLNSDSLTFSKYYIRDITVTKVNSGISMIVTQ